MIKKTLYVMCLMCTLNLHADYDDEEDIETPQLCKESQSCEKLSWKKFLLTTGLVVLSVTTFTLVGIRSSK
jgi:hypothetical protein